ncbi:uncharacterized protein LOC100533298 precursor [Aplysia californica]|uniref:Uncharacterized protein LOC100533298 precursor n=1 Tax=Aplysia californica TaxID=6500 RepID=Q8I818_APLCA|nr:uncharacterized protein LOC100533298 precursor [Aplysia californica]AAN83922.1 hypothetical protein [Aplysia californica]
MLRFLVFALPVAAVLLALAVTAQPPDNASGNICCQRDLINYTVLSENGTSAGGKGVRRSINAKFNLDFPKTRLSSKGSMVIFDESGIKNIEFWVITKSDKSIAIDEAQKSCGQIPLVWFPRFCVPSTAQKVGSYSYGPAGQTFQTDAYKFRLGDSDFFATIAPDCTIINLVQAVTSPNGGSLVSSVLTDIQPTVDESAFELPPYCKESFDSTVA